MLTVFGSVALDTIRTPKRTLKNVLGGAASYAAVSASRFAKTGLVAVVGTDLPERDRRTLGRHAVLDGLVTRPGKTFRYDGKYDRTLSVRTTIKTELNVLDGFRPTLPSTYASSRYVYLANNDPDQNLALLEKFGSARFSMCDTIDFWIKTKRSAVIKLMKRTDAAIMNDSEARLLAGEDNLARCAKKIRRESGVPFLIIKKGEHGALMFYKQKVVAAPGYLLEKVVDPTGAGDAFAGAMMGYLASLDSNVIRVQDLRRAMIFGNVMGSFAVEKYGLDGLLHGASRKAAIMGRADKYTSSFPH